MVVLALTRGFDLQRNMQLGVEPLELHPDRFFDSDREVRRMARTLFDETRTLPLVCAHGHVDPQLLAVNSAFPEPTDLLFTPDHYLVRMLYSAGIPLNVLGLSARDDLEVQYHPREIWSCFAAHYHRFLATPSGAWFDYELYEVFGVRTRLSAASADRIYDEISEKLRAPEFRPRALFERFGIEVLATTDSATASLEHHSTIRASEWSGCVIPTFRPDTLFEIDSPTWQLELTKLQQLVNRELGSAAEFVDALAERRLFFRALGATATDHGTPDAYTGTLTQGEADAIFLRACKAAVQPEDERIFRGHLLIEMARLSVEDGLVMQLHPGSFRNHNIDVATRFGPNRGGDIPVAIEFTKSLRPLLNAFGNNARFRLVLFTLDEATYGRELAPICGHYPAVRLGCPWWFNDSVEGIKRFRAQTTETAGIWNTAGFSDDARGLCSIPARHDLSRRVDANYLAQLVTRHQIGVTDARVMAQAMAYGLARDTYFCLDASRA